MNEQFGISGKWINKNTGNIINVRDSIIDGDNMIIISDHGEISMEIFSRDYLQVSDEIYNESGQVIDNSNVTLNEINVSKMEMPKVDMSNFDALEEIKVQEQPINKKNQIVSSSPTSINNFELIDKLFKKKNYNPVININIESEGFPKEELSLLMNIYDVKKEDISKYILQEYIHPENMIDSISTFLDKNFSE